MTANANDFFGAPRFDGPWPPARHHVSILRYLRAGRPAARAGRTRSLDILVVAAPGRPDAAGLVAGLRYHCALVCTSARQALGAARGFDPHVVVVDLRVPGGRSLARDLAARVGPATAFVALTPPGARPRPGRGRRPVFHYHIDALAAAGDLEQLFRRVSHDLAACRAEAPLGDDSGRPD
jgi:hypothetical protein